MDTPVKTSVYVPICLPTPKTDFTGSEVWVLGWGHTREWGKLSDTLQELKMTAVEDKVCQEALQGNKNSTDHFPGFLCAGGNSGEDSCQGDSGGPLQIEDEQGITLAGITSFGDGCAREGTYGVYTNIPREYEREMKSSIYS